MFCQNCGKQVSETASFCYSCGNQIQGFAQASNLQRNDIRKNEITELEKMISHFSLKREVYREYDYVCSIVEELSKGKKVALLVWGIILTAFGSLYTLISLFDNIPKEAIMIILLFTFFPGIMMLIFFIIHSVKHNNKKEIYFKKYYVLSNELYNHYLKYENCSIGVAYSNPDFLRFLLEKIYSGRADTIKEALNLTVDDSKYRDLSNKLSEIQRNTSIAATNAGMAAIFSAANLMK